jgi:hypothetical protein
MEFPTPGLLEAEVKLLATPNTFLRESMSADPVLFPAKNSWLTPSDHIRGFTAVETINALQIRASAPLVVFQLPLTLLLPASVTIRIPHPVDVVPHELRYWNPGGLPSGRIEYIDGNVPLSSLGEVEWRM